MDTSNSAHPPRAHPRALGFLETNRQMPHSGDKQAVQMPRGTGKKYVDFLVLGFTFVLIKAKSGQTVSNKFISLQ